MEAMKSWWQRVVSWFTYRGSDAEHEARVSLVVGLMVAKMSANQEVLIYSDSLKPAFFAEVLNDSECRFKILIDNVSAMNVIGTLSQSVQDRIVLRVSKSPKSKHFIVAGNSFRYELDGCHDEMFAVCNFNEPETALKLRIKFFEELWERSVPPPVL